MNPDLYDAYLTAGRHLHPAADWLVNQALTFGPGTALCAGAWLCLWAWEKTAPYFVRRRQLRAERRQIRRGGLPQPLPGSDRQALNTCNAILRATDSREETP